jgi:sugar phosphate isomerase/epimerase
MKIGAQMYTLRDYCKTLESFDNSMARIASAGYKSAQISGCGDFAAEEIRAVADKYGITIPLTHTSPQRIRDDTGSVIEAHRVMGAGYIGIGMMPDEYRNGLEGTDRFISDFSPAVEKIKAAGMKLMYHNHAMEFERFNGVSIIERMIDGFDSSAVGFTLDVYWVAHAGADPAYWLKKLNGRVDTIHYKDMSVVNNHPRMAAVGEGNLNWGAVISASKESGVKWAFVEQDDCYGADPFDCLTVSLRNLEKMV